MRALSNKAQAVLTVLREVAGEHTCNEIADLIRERTPCGACSGTGQCGDCQGRCRKCYGRGVIPFFYSDAYVVLKQLMDRGLVGRRHLLNEWGDETRSFVYRVLSAEGGSADELEAMFAAPAFGGTSGQTGPE